MLDQAFLLNEADVIAETVDGEAVIINLNSGLYFSADGCGGYVWQALCDGRTPAEISARLSSAFPAQDAALIEADVRSFLEAVLAADLLAPRLAADAATAPEPALPAAYQRPQLSIYSDFQELLKLDPIHEVHEAAGWPAPRPEVR
jgi:hypothetical protein